MEQSLPRTSFAERETPGTVSRLTGGFLRQGHSCSADEGDSLPTVIRGCRSRRRAAGDHGIHAGGRQMGVIGPDRPFDGSPENALLLRAQGSQGALFGLQGLEGAGVDLARARCPGLARTPRLQCPGPNPGRVARGEQRATWATFRMTAGEPAGKARKGTAQDQQESGTRHGDSRRAQGLVFHVEHIPIISAAASPGCWRLSDQARPAQPGPPQSLGDSHSVRPHPEARLAFQSHVRVAALARQRSHYAPRAE